MDGKEEGMGRAKRHANQEWWFAALVCAKMIAEKKPYFNSGEVEELRRALYPNHTTHELKALGPLMREAARLGYCIPTVAWYQSRQKTCHRRPMMTWKSLIFKGPMPPPRRRFHPPNPSQFDLFGGA